MKETKIDYTQLIELYPLIYQWLTTQTLGGYSKKSKFQYYDKKLWIPLQEMFREVGKVEYKSLLDEEFLKCCYMGNVYRIQTYNERLKGYICPLGCYQSWTTEDGFEAISRIGGNVLLICGHVNENTIAINTFELLCFIIRCFKPMLPYDRYHPKNLEMYEPEFEIVMPIKESLIDKVIIVDSKKIEAWKTVGIEIPYNKWFRKDLR